MDSEHRHELKTNELADWIVHAPEYVRKNYITILGILLVIAGLLSWPILKKNRLGVDTKQAVETTQLIEKVSQRKALIVQGSQQGGSLIGFASSLEIAASDAKTDLAEALILIKRAEALRAELHYKAEEIEEVILLSEIERARVSYEKAVKKAKGNANLEAMATFGLGLCAEEIGDYTKASGIYESIVSNAGFEGTIFPAKAKARIETMADNRESFVFVNAPEPVKIEVPAAPVVAEPVVPKVEAVVPAIEKPAVTKPEETKPASEPEEK